MTPVSAVRYQHPDFDPPAQGPEMIRISFDDGSEVSGAPDCGDATFRAALYGDAELGWAALTVADAE